MQDSGQSKVKRKILMVCHGNICRSPLAEEILREKLKEKNIVDIEVNSAGTSDYHAGNPSDQRTIENAKSHGVDLSAHKARQFKSADFSVYDRIYVMDQANMADVALLAESEKEMEKVKLFLDAAYPGSGDNVPDPWYGGEKDFEKVFHIIYDACSHIVKRIRRNQLP